MLRTVPLQVVFFFLETLKYFCSTIIGATTPYVPDNRPVIKKILMHFEGIDEVLYPIVDEEILAQNYLFHHTNYSTIIFSKSSLKDNSNHYFINPFDKRYNYNK